MAGDKVGAGLVVRKAGVPPGGLSRRIDVRDREIAAITCVCVAGQAAGAGVVPEAAPGEDVYKRQEFAPLVEVNRTVVGSAPTTWEMLGDAAEAE